MYNYFVFHCISLFYLHLNFAYKVLTLCFRVVPPEFGSHKFSDKLTLYAGQSVAVEIPFGGSPQPTAQWQYKDGRLPDSRRFKEDTIKNMTSLTMSKVQRSDAGPYTLKLGNKYGESIFNITLVVLGK